MFTITAYAAKNYFEFDLLSGAVPTNTGINNKSDAEQTAYVTITSLTTNGIAYAQVMDGSLKNVTDPITMTSVGAYRKNYNRYAYAGEGMYLKVWSTLPGHIAGKWNS